MINKASRRIQHEESDRRTRRNMDSRQQIYLETKWIKNQMINKRGELNTEREPSRPVKVSKEHPNNTDHSRKTSLPQELGHRIAVPTATLAVYMTTRGIRQVIAQTRLS